MIWDTGISKIVFSSWDDEVSKQGTIQHGGLRGRERINETKVTFLLEICLLYISFPSNVQRFVIKYNSKSWFQILIMVSYCVASLHSTRESAAASSHPDKTYTKHPSISTTSSTFVLMNPFLFRYVDCFSSGT